MTGAILYATKYGSTRDYARWIAEATGLALHDMHRDHPDLESLNFLVIGMPVIYHRLYGRKWVLRHRDAISRKPSILFTVSGVPAGEKLDRWVADSLPSELIEHMRHIALRGRQNPKDLNLWDRTMLIIGGLTNPDRKAGREELHGFDFMDRDGIRPVVDLIER